MTGAEALGYIDPEHRIQFYLNQGEHLQAGHLLGYELLNNTEVIFFPV